MRKAFKAADSKIVSEQLKYIANNSANNKKIAQILLEEQKHFCAYTDEYISRTDARDIEHFNPTLKETDKDDYNNWYLVKNQWNKEKSEKWDEFQPVLNPSAEDFEDRIVYKNGDYLSASATDVESTNLIALLKLDDLMLADKRKKYIARNRSQMDAANQEANTYFTDLLNAAPFLVFYPRAIKEEFKVDILAMIK